MSVDNARKTYLNAVNRLLEILKVTDSEKPGDLSRYRKQIEERSGKIPKDQKWFLLNKLFGIMPSEIAEMEGSKGSSVVRQLITRVSDQLRAGEIRLIDSTPEEESAAKSRLDEQREKRRKRDERSKNIPMKTQKLLKRLLYFSLLKKFKEANERNDYRCY